MNWNSDQRALIQWITSGLKIKEVRDLKGDWGYLLNKMAAEVTLERFFSLYEFLESSYGL